MKNSMPTWFPIVRSFKNFQANQEPQRCPDLLLPAAQITNSSTCDFEPILFRARLGPQLRQSVAQELLLLRVR